MVTILAVVEDRGRDGRDAGGHADGETCDAKRGGIINYRRSEQRPPMGPAVGYSPVIRNSADESQADVDTNDTSSVTFQR